MAFTYETVMIGSQPYAVYGNVDAATLYLQASITSAAVAWMAASLDTKKKTLVTAVRWMDAQKWTGTPTDVTTPQDLQWPRVGVVDQYGNAIPDNELPPQIPYAEFELAAYLVTDADFQANLQNPTPRSLTAGSVNITYFRPPGFAFGAKDVQTLTPFPQNVMDLVGIWLGSGVGNSALSPVQAQGVDCPSPLDDYPGFVRGF